LLISEQFKCFGAAAVPLLSASAILEEALKEFGPTIRTKLSSFSEARQFLLPLKSFTTRYVVFERGNWSLVVSDMRDEASLVDVFLFSRVELCDAISLRIQESRRDFAIFKAGKKLRQVESLLDFDAWHFRQTGQLQEFEDASECTRPRKSARLSVAAVRRYFTAFTGMEFPKWTDEEFTNAVGLERSTQSLLVSVENYETADDMNPNRISRTKAPKDSHKNGN
jgi:hypothetical protein